MKTFFKVVKSIFYVVLFFVAFMWITSTDWFADFMNTSMEEECTFYVENKNKEAVSVGILAGIKEEGWKYKGRYELKPGEKAKLFIVNKERYFYYAESENYIWNDTVKYVKLKSGDSLGMIMRRIPRDIMTKGEYTLTLE